jgi:hypothetical protein
MECKTVFLFSATMSANFFRAIKLLTLMSLTVFFVIVHYIGLQIVAGILRLMKMESKIVQTV